MRRILSGFVLASLSFGTGHGRFWFRSGRSPRLRFRIQKKRWRRGNDVEIRIAPPPLGYVTKFGRLKREIDEEEEGGSALWKPEEEKEENKPKLGLTLFFEGLFGLFLILSRPPHYGIGFFQSCFLQQGLSIINLIVLAFLFHRVRAPPILQSRILNISALFGVTLRSFIIGAGIQLIHTVKTIILILGFILFAPRHWDLYGTRHRPYAELGTPRRFLTAVYLSLVGLGLSDMIFAVDSIPTFGFIVDPLGLCASNIFSSFSIPHMFELISGPVLRLRRLERVSIALILFAFFKTCAEYFEVYISNDIALVFVSLMLFHGVGLSLWMNYQRKRTNKKDQRILKQFYGMVPLKNSKIIFSKDRRPFRQQKIFHTVSPRKYVMLAKRLNPSGQFGLEFLQQKSKSNLETATKLFLKTSSEFEAVLSSLIAADR